MGSLSNVKNKEKYEAGILDCRKEDPEKSIEMTLVDGMVSAKSTDETNPQASLTADLLNEVFNETNTSIRTAAAEVRVNEALKEMTKLYGVLGHYRRFTDSRQLDNQFLKALLSRNHLLHP